MRVLVFGTYDTSMHPRVATIAEGLRATGVDVLECNAPLGLDTKSRVAALASPSKVPALLLRIARRWITLARAARKMPLRPDVVLVGYMGHFDVHLAKLLFRKVPIVLDHLIGASDTARDRRLDAGPRQKLMGMIDSGALRKADVILVDTDEHLAALPDRYRERAVVVPVGAPEAWFTAAAARADADAEAAVTAELSGEQAEVVGPLRVVFFGLYTPLQGAPVIGAALGSLAGEPIEVTMVGTGQDETETKTAAAANKAVRWLDWVASSELPGVVAGHEVCLGIFGTGEKALRVVPNKVFQGAAAGCAIITSDTAPQRRTLGDAVVYVPAGDSAALADALRTLAADRAELSRLRGEARDLVQQRFSPAQVVAPLLERLDTAVPGQDGRDRTESTTMRS